MEALEKAQLREQQKLNPEQVFKSVVINSLNDIKRIISEFDPNRNPKQINIPLNTILEANEDGKRNVYKVTADTCSKSKRDILIDGFRGIKDRAEIDVEHETIEINGKQMRSVTLNNDMKGRSWVDPLINQWTGGIREGILITWVLNKYKYKYNIFQHKLSRIDI